MRKIVVAVSLLAILCVVNFSIWQKEDLLAHGRIVLLELAPVDPRSLMQGDYMALRFRIINDAFGRGERRERKDGHIVVVMDEKGVANFKRFDDGAQLTTNKAS